jgi:hypothetical protein
MYRFPLTALIKIFKLIKYSIFLLIVRMNMLPKVLSMTEWIGVYKNVTKFQAGYSKMNSY